jgi:hypothetical protein
MIATDFIVRVQVRPRGGVCKAHDFWRGGCNSHGGSLKIPSIQAQNALSDGGTLLAQFLSL